MKTDLPSTEAKSEWTPRKVRIAGERKTVFVRETGGDNYALQVRLGREAVTIYRRKMPNGNFGFMLANYAEGKRRFDSHPSEDAALEAADVLVKKLAKRQVVAAALTNAQASSYLRSVELVEPTGDPLELAATRYAACFEILGSGERMEEACRYFKERNPDNLPQATVAEVAAEFIKSREARGKSERYVHDLRNRLDRFATAFAVQIKDVTTPDVQRWLDGLKVAPQTAKNFRTVIHTLFAFAESRGFILRGSNPVAATEKISATNGDAVVIYKPEEMARLLAAAAPAFKPCLALGGFAGLRTAEILRLEWSEVDLPGGHITVAADKAKTASRRIVPIAPNLAAWLKPRARRAGRVWKGTAEDLYTAQAATAEATAVEADAEKGVKAKPALDWRANALRHSYASYRLAELGDAGKVALELGNSPAVVFRHYRELVKPAAAKAWFAIRPEAPANVVGLPQAAAA